MLYFIQNTENKSVKVGYSASPAKRLKGLNTGSSDPLEILGEIPGSLGDERKLHDFLDANFERRHGEYFEYSEGLMAHIRSLVERQNGLLSFFQRQNVLEPHLCYLTSIAVGFAVSIYYLGFAKPYKYQVMRWTESEGRGLSFWHWYLWERPQWYDTPAEAAAQFVLAWDRWKEDGGELR